MGLFTDLYEWATASGRRTTPSTTIKEQGFSGTPPTWGIMNDVIGKITDALTLLDVGLTDSEFKIKATPTGGGWQVVRGIGAFAGSDVFPSTSGGYLDLTYSLSELAPRNRTDATSEWVLDSVVLYGVCESPSHLILHIETMSGEEWVAGPSLSGTGPTITLTPALVLLSNTAYRIRVEMYRDSGAAPSDCYITSAEITLTRNGVP